MERVTLANGIYRINTCNSSKEKSIEVKYKWTYKSMVGKQKDIGLSLLLSKDDINAAEEIDSKVKGMTMADMGIEQENLAFQEKLQEAIVSGNTDLAQTLIENNEQKGSFYNREWQAYHKVLKDTAIDFVKKLFQGFLEIGDMENLHRKDIPYLLIAFVQSIPYDGLPGISSPITVIANKSGACAAKSYLLYLLLKEEGVFCVIWGSQAYNHIMLGLNINASGTYKKLAGQKYYFLETTIPDSPIGKIQDQMNDMENWELIDIK